MSYIDPTPADLKARFAIFSSVDDAVVQTAIDEAGRRVDQTWPEEDFTLAKMLYAAHTLTLDGLGSGREAKMAGMKSVQIGQLQFQRALPDNATLGGLESTSFGLRFLELARLNFSGGSASVALTPVPPWPGDCW